MASTKRYPVTNLYGANGSAAYDMRGSAAPELPRPSLPQERPAPQKVVRVKGKLAVSPFATFGFALSAIMLIMVIFGYVQLYEATSVVGKLESQLSTLTAQNNTLMATYESKIDLGAIEVRATEELGLVQPTTGQTYQVNLAGEDRAEVIEILEKSPFEQMFGAIKTSIEGLVAYFS